MNSREDHDDLDGQPRRDWRTTTGKIFAVVGALFQAGPPLGYLIATGIVRYINNPAVTLHHIYGLGSHPPSNPETTILKGYVRAPMEIGIWLGVVGLILLALALFTTRYRTRWFFWFLTVYGAVLTVVAPYLLCGSIFLVYALVRRRDFFPHNWRESFFFRNAGVRLAKKNFPE